MIPDALLATVNDALVMKGDFVLEGWTEPQRGAEMAEFVISQRPNIIVEIGTFGARSTIAMGAALRHNQCGKIYTIDPWRKENALEAENDANRAWWDKLDLHKIHAGAMEAIWRHGLDEWIVVIRASSQNCWDLFRRIDILSIDGNHSEFASTRDVQLYLPAVVTGGLIFFDDADWPSTQTAMRLLDTSCEKLKDSGNWRVYRKK